MVIQRWQTVWLFLAAVLMGLFPWVPFGEGFKEGAELMLQGSCADYILMLILGYCSCGLLLADIFLFKNFKLQKGVLYLAMAVIAVIAGFVVYYNIAAGSEGYTVVWSGGCYMIVAAFILAYFAFRGIRHDERLLRSYDRLR